MESKMVLEQLGETFSEITKTVSTLENAKFFHKERAEKWSIAEEVHHLSLTLFPINNLLKHPSKAFGRYGHSGRKSRDMETFEADYEASRSGLPWKTFPPFVPKTENESSGYAELHYASDQGKVNNFYKLTGTQIQGLRDMIQIKSSAEKEDITGVFSMQTSSFLSIAGNFDDTAMDDIQMPLPYIGLVTLKEILYFTLNHSEYHLRSIAGNSTCDQ